MDSIFVSVDVILVQFSVPFVGHLGHRYDSDLVSLPYDFLVAEVVEVIEDQPGRGLFDARLGLAKGLDGLDPEAFLLECHLSGDVANQFLWQFLQLLLE